VEQDAQVSPVDFRAVAGKKSTCSGFSIQAKPEHLES
jgi:hypothetical protein